MLPYRDFFDMKGPYLFFIEYISQLISFGRVGCFIYQCFNLFAVFCLLDRIHLIAATGLGYIKRFILLFPYMFIMAATFEGGNLTEELSLPFILICVYLAAKHLSTPDPQNHPVGYAFVYGACFGIISFIRITNAVTICALVLHILIILLINKRYQSILHHAVAFILGFALSVLPAVIYYAKNGLLSEMFNTVFLFGLTYANENGLINRFFLQPEKQIFVLPLLLSSAIALVSTYRNRSLKQLIWLDLVCLTLALSISRSYAHYFTLIIPHIALGFVIVAHDINHKRWISKNTCQYAFLIFLCLFSLISIIHYYSFSPDANIWIDHDAISIAEIIPENETDSVYTYGIGSSWYTTTGLYPCIRYCDWQNNYISLKPEIQDELISIFHSTPPKWVVTRMNEQPEFLQTILNEQYILFAENASYMLWSSISL